MIELSDANILLALDQHVVWGRATLSDLIVYGRVRSLIKRPSILGDTIVDGNGYYAILDAYAIKCLKEDYFHEPGMSTINSLYFTKGSILIYIDSSKWVGKDVKVAGKRPSWGCNLRRQNEKTKTTGITAFCFESNPERRGKKTYYTLACNSLRELGTSDSECRGTVLEDLMVQIQKSKNGVIPYPESLDSLVPYSGVETYEVINVEDVKDTFEDNDNVDISKIDMNLTYHLEGKPLSKNYAPFKEDLDDNKYRRSEYKDSLILQLKQFQGSSTCDSIARDIRDKFIKNIAGNYTKRISPSIKYGDYVTAFINGCSDSSCWQKDKEVVSEESNKLIQKGIDLLRKQVSTDPTVLYGSTGTEIDAIDTLSDDLVFATIVVAISSGIGINSLSSNYSYFSKNFNMSLDSWFYALINIPYLLALIGVSLKTADADVIYYSYRKKYTDDSTNDICKDLREKLLFLDTLSKKADTDTFVDIWKLKGSEPSYSQFSALSRNYFPTNASNTVVLSRLLGIDIKLAESEISFIKNKNWYSARVQKDLQNIGAINILDDKYIALERELEEEMMIYETFQYLGCLKTGISEDNLEPIIKEFEKSRGFSLESLQKDAIKLCLFRAGVLSGCAGSGKTTTSDCMTEVLKTLPGYDIIYCAPTGKAARRLSEVVHRPVKTIHSQFCVGIGDSSYMQDVSKSWRAGKSGKHIYILDEMAMCATPLMYELARNITEDDIIYFLGDIKQLPPVGKGCPFKVLMDLLPCVELGVSKRAAEGSLVNYNSSLVNFVSDDVVNELKYDNDTFVCRETNDINLVNATVQEFKKYMSGTYGGKKFNEDDIQVITGYQKKEIDFSVGNLNEPLQELLRGNSTPIFYHTKDKKLRKFYTNDRVIHTSVNSYEMCRYVDMGGGILESTLTFGIANGDMGKLLGVVKPDSINIFKTDIESCKAGEGVYSNVSEEEMKAIKERYTDREDKLRDDSKISGDRFYFVVVKVYDTDLRRDVLILYRATGSMTTDGLLLQGADLSNLELAYALTCHKMQGSQSPVVILPFGTQGNPHFINRNMINTMITRSQGYVCCVGDIKGSDSLLNQGRRYVSKTTSNDLLSILVNS